MEMVGGQGKEGGEGGGKDEGKVTWVCVEGLGIDEHA